MSSSTSISTPSLDTNACATGIANSRGYDFKPRDPDSPAGPQRKKSILDVLGKSTSSQGLGDEMARALRERKKREKKVEVNDKGKGEKTAASQEQHQLQSDMVALGLDLAEIRVLVTAFRAADPNDDGLDPKEFEAVTGMFLSSKTNADMDALFDLFDFDQTGRVTLREFICGYSTLCHGSTEERMRYLFSMLDSSGKGYLNQSDLRRGTTLISRYSVGDRPVQGSSSTNSGNSGSSASSYRNCPINLAEIAQEVDKVITFSKFMELFEEHVALHRWLDALSSAAGCHLQTLREAKERELVSLELERLGLLGANPIDGPRATESFWSGKISDSRYASSELSYASVRRTSDESNLSQSISGPVNSPFIIDFESLTLKSVIGRGASATVWSAEWLRMPVAVKIFEDHSVEFPSPSDSTAVKRRFDKCLREIEVLTQIRHPNILLYMALCIKPSLCIITELYKGGSVHDFLHGLNARRFSPMQAISMMKNVAQAMVYLHSSKPQILHRDLKTSNILMDSSVTHCVICDFGLSRLADSSKSREASAQEKAVGTAITMSPQVMQGEPYKMTDDVYSFGIVAWEMFCGESPFRGMKSIQLMFAVCEGKRPKFESTVVNWPPTLVNLIKRCWQEDPGRRPNFNEILDVLESDALLREIECSVAHNTGRETLERPSDADSSAASNEKGLQEGQTNSEERSEEVRRSREVRKRLAACNELIMAVYSKDGEEVRKILKQYEDNADLCTSLEGLSDYDKRTPLHIATSEGLYDICRILIEGGAPLDAQDRWGNTPLQDAQRAGHKDIVDLIEQAYERNKCIDKSR